jgi:hypothetical protein
MRGPGNAPWIKKRKLPAKPPKQIWEESIKKGIYPNFFW